MSSPPRNRPPLPTGLASRLDPVCDRFEAAWKAGQRPRIEDFLADVEDADRGALLGELIILEVEYRNRAGEQPSSQEYEQRFPDYLAQIDAAIARTIQSPAEQRTLGPREVAPAPPRMPAHIGRYRIDDILGEGGFGLVYLAYDQELGRAVAIKVPRPDRLVRPGDAAEYLKEARTLASLDHPNIVPIFDVGTTPEGHPFVVSKLIEGTDLAKRISQARPSFFESATLLATVAEALHFTHRKGLVHRDVKPGNILIDKAGQPFVADFGLALKEEDFGKGGGILGTPAYMSPEQANGEGHRVDGRSDIFSLGGVLYELLTGRRPFRGEPQAVLIQIVTDEPRPPRQIDDSIPKELERICLKALAKRASERYTTAKDLADDLHHFLGAATPEEKSTASLRPVAEVAVSTPAPTPVITPRSDHRPLKIVPKGLRSFNANDADFFLELLPGPRDRDGLPDSIRFWKTRIEERDPDNTFAVGLIYGPSGCGKSSLVKAGLLPRLSGDILSVYVEATAEETETRLLNGLRKRCPGLPDGLGLKETLLALRRGLGMTAGKKVVIVLDQFEQFLHAKKGEQQTELVQALRQCDGGRLQAVVMVRDDFWLAVSRFLRDLEIRLLESQNSALTDLFDVDHARRVLGAFGRAFGKLPESDPNKEQKQFLTQAVAGLAQEGKVVSVRLALFAEMMKGKTWTPAVLKEMGGASGVGVTFLEETFSAATAPPEHRYHQKAARAVLKALMPESGTDIKGHMRSHQELLEASGYASRPRDFDDLMRILDGEIRLITPTDPEGKDEDGRMKDEPDKSVDSSFILHPSSLRYYQLTHDYLVPSLRDWLTRKQKETRRGRAELLLADRAAVWNARPENRQLPSLVQWCQIKWHTGKKNHTSPQRKMMRQATRFHATRGLIVALLLALIGLGSWEAFGRYHAGRLRDRLLEATTADVPGIVKDMTGYRRWVDPLLRDALDQATEPTKKLHASLALLPVDKGQVDYLYERLLEGDPREVVVIREALLANDADLTEKVWTLLNHPRNDQSQRFRAAAALVAFAPDDPRWEKASADVAAMLVVQKPFQIGAWTEAFTGVGSRLIPPLGEFLEDEKRSISERGLIATIYGTYAADRPEAYARLGKRLAEVSKPDTKASLGVALMVMGKPTTVWPLLKHSNDPTARSYLIERLGPGGVDYRVLFARLAEVKDVSVRRAILLSLGHYGLDRLSLAERGNHLPSLLTLYQDDTDPGIHGAVEWLLRKWEKTDEVKKIDKQLTTGKVEGKRQWYINRQGQTMVMIPGPVTFWMGSPESEVGRSSDETRHRRRIGRTFAIAAKDVTVDQFKAFRKAYAPWMEFAPKGDCPANKVAWNDAAAYCNWLSEKEGIPKEQWCYEPNKEGKYAEGMKMAPNYLKRTGYRLPTEAEWEYACRAEAGTAYSFGEAAELLGKYGWFAGNSLSKSHPVGSLKANDLGLFDMHGNVCQWCQDVFKPYPKQEEGKTIEDKQEGAGNKSILVIWTSSRILRGGAFSDPASVAHCHLRLVYRPASLSVYFGFRVARTFIP